MNNILAAIFVVALLTILAFVAIGGSFDRPFWLNFLPGLMANLAALLVAVLIVERILAKDRADKLAQTNTAKSKFVHFLSNRLAYKVLEYLGLANEDEAKKDAELNFQFAPNRLKNVDLATVFYGKLMQAEDKEIFIEGFAKILREHHEPISKALDEIYPRPDPNLKFMHFSSGMVHALAMLPNSYKAANQQLREEDRLKPEQLNSLLKIGYPPIQEELQSNQEAIVQLSERAKDNQLFISFS